MPDWLPWGNVALRDCSRRHMLRGSPLIGHWSADAPDGGRLVTRSGISAGDFNEDGLVLIYENGECESPA